MTDPLALLKPWIEALERFAQALKVYVEVIDDTAQKARPSSREAYRNALDDSARLADMADSRKEETGVALAESSFDAMARLEKIQGALNSGAAAALDPTLFDASLQAMSHTFVEGVEQKAERLRTAQTQAEAAARASIESMITTVAPAIAETVPAPEMLSETDALSKTHALPPAVSSLYTAVLDIWARKGVDVGALVESMKDRAVGVRDTPAAVRTALDAREKLHPIQAMAITFGMVPSAEAGAPDTALVVIDAALPQARTAVRYKLAPLIDYKAAEAFGRIASTRAGLNFRLVERLRTVVEESLGSGAGASIVSRCDGAPEVVRSIDRGLSYAKMVLPQNRSPGQYTAIGAGPRLRIERQGHLLEEAVFRSEGTTRTFSDPEKLVESYNTKVDSMDPSFSLDELGQALQSHFAEALDAALKDVVTAEMFLSIALGQRDTRDPYRTYIAKTIAEVTKRGSEKVLLRNTLSGSQSAAKLFGSQALAARGGRQELLLTQVSELRASILATQKALANAYARIDGPKQAQSIFATGGPPSVQKTARTRRLALDLYRAVVDEAFYSKRRPSAGRAAKAVEKNGTIETRLSLKTFLLEHGAGGSRA